MHCIDLVLIGVYYFAMIKDSNPLTFGKFNPASYKYPSNKAYLTVVKNLQQARLTVSFGEEDGFGEYCTAGELPEPLYFDFYMDGQWANNAKFSITL